MSNNLTAIDLFAGAGGLSLGFEMAGFHVPAAIEIDDWAADTYENNRKEGKVFRTDIKELSDNFFGQFSGLDAVIGGPPCQGFSISTGNRKNPNDPRNYLYKHFFRAVRVIRPQIVFIENVKGILTAKHESGELILKDICSSLEKLGYSFTFGLLNAVDFGVPQDRIRFFLIAGLHNTFKEVLKPGNFVQERTLFSEERLQRNLWDAISDLPGVQPNQHKEDDVLLYKNQPENDYQQELRGESQLIYNHIPMRHTQRIIERFKLIQIGENHAKVPASHGARKRSNPMALSGIAYDQNHRRLNPYKPSPTITASFYSSFIHPFEQRNITVREAARIQSFPDNYRFYGKRTTLSKKLLARKGIFEDIHLDQFNQVGNSVPPLLAKEIAKRITINMEKSFYA